MADEAETYFRRLESQVEAAVERAARARAQGWDPSEDVEIPIARDMADRVQNLLGFPGVADRIRELEAEMSREEAALALASDFAEGTVGNAEGTAETIEQAVRTAVALLTEGVVAAPIEGIDGVDVLTNDDGSSYVRVYYAGPIRSAGGTAQALSVLVADYTRALLGIDAFQPREQEIERLAEEVALYDEDTGLQYAPAMDEARFIAGECPICLDGEPTSEDEVSGFRDLERIDTNRARGGMCLVLAEGIAQKAPKIKRYTDELDEIDWPWIDELIEGEFGSEGESAEPEESDEDEETSDVGGLPVPEPNERYLDDLIAGRPVFAHPSRPGGFRLRYGRARNHGFATAGVHPATMHLLDEFLAPGTQLKTERPGKAAGVVPVDSIEGPTVRLATGEVRRLEDPEEAAKLRGGVERILDVGEYLVNAGEFVENNYPLAPAAYTVEWWVQEFEAAGADVPAFRDDAAIDLEDPGPERALGWAQAFDAPLHPRYTYLWHDLAPEDIADLAEAVESGQVIDGALVIERTDRRRDLLEALLVPHYQDDDSLRLPTWQPFARSLGIEVRGEALSRTGEIPNGVEDGLAAINALAPFEVRAKAPTRIGNRMGRPEKSEQREMRPPVHTLFPLGNAGGDRRDVADASRHAETMSDTPGEIVVELGQRRCPTCETDTDRLRCPSCESRTEHLWTCPSCERELGSGEEAPTCPKCEEPGTTVTERTINVDDRYHQALKRVDERESSVPILKGVKGLMSREKTPEAMAKGVLRAKHEVSAFKDGTVRYDMTDLPVTSVRPAELGVTAGHFRELGYEEDIHGEPLEHDDQLVELRVQDVILSTGAGDHLVRTANFVDDLLERFYEEEPFYEVDEREDLVGELVLGLAPHTSAAVVGRIVGFTEASVGYAHPYFHAAKRRNCFHPETKLWYADEGEKWQESSIKAFVERLFDDPKQDDFGTVYEEVPDGPRVISLDAEGSLVSKQVTAVSKHPAPAHLVRVQTQEGREMTVTSDHRMIRWVGGTERVKATDLEVGDAIPVYEMNARAPLVAPAASIINDGGQPRLDKVERTEIVRSDTDHTYCLTVDETHTLFANGLATAQCDGDEDCVMLLMDGLLNFSQSFLPESRGGSVGEDSRLLGVSPEGNVAFLTFEEFWEALESPVHRDGKFRKKSCFKEGWRTYVFDDEHSVSLQPIEKAIRYEAGDEEHLIRVETQFGREIEITRDHSLFRFDDGIEEIAGEDLEPGDHILAPRQLEIESRQESIQVEECVDNPYLFIGEDVEETLTTAWEEADRGGPLRNKFINGLAYRLDREKISWGRYHDIVENSEAPDCPAQLMVGRKGSSNGIPAHIPIDEELGWLLGIFVAEGSLSGGAVTIHNSDRDIIDRCSSIIRSTLKTEPYVRWSNRAYEIRLPRVFADVLYELGFEQRDEYNSSEKVIPKCILRAPENIVLSFLRGYITGDGSNKQDDNVTTVAFHTTSEAVRDGVIFLLQRLGVMGTINTIDDREGNRQDLYVVTVSGGASDNPLRRAMIGDSPYLPKSLSVPIPSALMEIREMSIQGIKQLIPKYLKRRDNISLQQLTDITEELGQRQLPPEAAPLLADLQTLVSGELAFLRVKNIEQVDYDGYLYDLQVGGEPIFTTNWLFAHNSMDAPLVMSTRIDPSEIDDEAHNIDTHERYPVEFYEATLEGRDPGEVEIPLAEDSVGTPAEYSGFTHTHDTADIAAGPELSAYKTLESMMDKMEAQLELARNLRAVDETDVAERVIESHFLPDLLGNLRAFSSQESRCIDCGMKYRRMPLSRTCRRCDGNVVLTVHEGSVSKYMETALRIARQYDCRDYTIQRLELLERSLESIFEDDHNKQSGIADFM